MTPINQADTAWMLVATALVLVMTPALGFFYGGLVRAKNALNTMMMSYVALGFVGIAWAFIGYTFAFSTGGNWLGGLDNAFFRGVGLDAKGTIPHILFAGYQATFCVITAALISGAIVERMRFGPYVASSRSGRSWSTRRSRTGCGAVAGSASSALSISRVAPSFTSTPPQRRSWSRWYSARGRTTRGRRSFRRTCPSRCWAPASSGSAGSASTVGARSQRMDRRRSPSP